MQEMFEQNKNKNVQNKCIWTADTERNRREIAEKSQRNLREIAEKKSSDFTTTNFFREATILTDGGG